jgi:hypothetical protein
MVRQLWLKDLRGEVINWWDIAWDKIYYNPVNLFFRHLYRFTKRLVTWLPLCWNTENWDYEGYYDFIMMFMKDQLKAQEEDIWHCQKDVKRRIQQIKICIEYLKRYRDWPKYYKYPEPQHIPREDPKYGTVYSIVYKRGDNIKAKEASLYEEFNKKMFWKRFLQWHQGWWT